MICPCPERAISNKLQQPQPTQPPYSSTALEACLGLEGENRQLREQIAELEKQPLQKGTVKAPISLHFIAICVS